MIDIKKTLFICSSFVLATALVVLGVVTYPAYVRSMIFNGQITPDKSETLSGVKPQQAVDVGTQPLLASANISLPLQTYTTISSLNLLTNSSFEANGDGDSHLAWENINTSAANIQVSSKTVRTGTHALQFSSSATSPTVLGVQQEAFSTINGRSYIFSLYIRGSQLAGSPILRMGFMGGKQEGEYLGKADAYQDFVLTPALLRDWTQISFQYQDAGLGKHPVIQILNYQNGTLTIDDASVFETAPSQQNNTVSALYQSLGSIGDGSLLGDSTAHFYPTSGLSGSLGLSSRPFGALYVNDGTFTSNVAVGGSVTIQGDATVSGNLHYTNSTSGPAHFSSSGLLGTSAIDLGSSDVTSILGVGNGGTGTSSFTQNGVLYGNGSSAIATLTPGTAGYVLQSNGLNSAPSWANLGSMSSTNALTLLGSTWASPGAIGITTPSSGAFTTLSSTSDFTGNASLFIKGPKPWADVQAYGAKGDGSTDDTTAIQSAIDAVNTAGGGEVRFPAGTYITTTLTIYSKIHIRGAGIEASIIKLKNNSNVDLVKSYNFDALTGTNSIGGIYNWSINDITLDGNKSNNTSSYGLHVYGFGFILQNLRVRNAALDGIYSEWSSSSNSPGIDSMEAHLSGVKVHDSGVNGITWAGPHDSTFVNVQSYINADKGVWFKSAATGTQVTNGHAWGNTNYGWYIEGGSISLNNTEGEGSTIAQVMVGSGNDTIMGGIYFAGGSSLASATGIKIGDGTHTATGFYIDTLVKDFHTGTGIAFVGDGGGGSVKADIYQTGSTSVTGTPSTSTTVNIHASGGGTGAVTNIASGNVGIGNVAPSVKLDVKGTIRAVGGSANIGSYVIPMGGSGNSFRMGNGNNIYFDGTNWVSNGDGSNNGGSLLLSGYGSTSSNFVFYTMPSTGGTAQTIADGSLSTFERMRLTTTGNLGLGNASPATKLDISGATTGRALVNINETGDQSFITASASGVTRFTVSRAGDLIVAAGAKWQPLTDSTTALNIAKADGTSFVNFDSVSTRFVVTGTSGQLLKLNTSTSLSTDSSTILYNSRVSIGYDGTLQGILLTDSGNTKPTAFSNGGLERMRITPLGGVGIGTTTPLAALQINGNYAGNASLLLNSLNSADIIAASTSGTTVFRLANNGDLILANAVRIMPLSDSSTAINFANSAGTSFLNLDTTNARIIMTGSAGQFLRLVTTGNTSAETATILFNNRAIMGYDATTQSVLISDSATNKPITFQTGNPDVERMRIAGTGAIGINTSAPTAQLHIAGAFGSNAAVIVNQLNAGDVLAASVSGVTKFRIDASGNVIVPNLNTAGGMIFTDSAGQLTTTGQGSSSQCLISNGSSTPTWTNCAGAAGMQFISLAGAIVPVNSTQDFMIGGQSTASAKFGFLNSNSGIPTASISAGLSGALVLSADGKVVTTSKQSLSLGDANTGSILFPLASFIGMGTTSPTAKVEISGSGGNYIKLTTTTSLSTDTIYQMFNNRATFGYDGTLQGVLITDNNTSKPIAFQTSNVERLRITAAGLFGLGTTTPLASFDLRGVHGTLPVASISGQTSFAALTADQAGVGDIFTASRSGATRFVITNVGNVGVGDSNPTNTLKVVGSLCVKTATGACAGSLAGTIYASTTVVQSADLAENYVSALPLEPGDLVVPAADGNNAAVKMTENKYDPTIIGVVSTKPGFTMNSDAKTDAQHPYLYPIGLSGRVPVNVSSENGDIHVGDALTSSSQPGIAMKATQAGPVIGKALEAFSNSDTHQIGKIVLFAGVSWYGPVSQDAAGYALIPAGQTQLDVHFAQPKSSTPVVTLTLKSLTKLDAYRVTNESPQGFTIEITPAQSADVEFAWSAIQPR